MNYLDILVRASISVPAAAKNVKLTNEIAQVGSTFNASHRLSCKHNERISKTGKKINHFKTNLPNRLDF